MVILFFQTALRAAHDGCVMILVVCKKKQRVLDERNIYYKKNFCLCTFVPKIIFNILQSRLPGTVASATIHMYPCMYNQGGSKMNKIPKHYCFFFVLVLTMHMLQIICTTPPLSIGTLHTHTQSTYSSFIERALFFRFQKLSKIFVC